MKNHTAPAVRCTYCSSGNSLSDILEASFRLYLKRVLTAADDRASQEGTQCAWR